MLFICLCSNLSNSFPNTQGHLTAFGLDLFGLGLLFFCLSLSQVPGVAENRPSVLRGDNLNVYLSEDKAQPITVYKGYVHRVELESVKLGFSKK